MVAQIAGGIALVWIGLSLIAAAIFSMVMTRSKRTWEEQ